MGQWVCNLHDKLSQIRMLVCCSNRYTIIYIFFVFTCDEWTEGRTLSLTKATFNFFLKENYGDICNMFWLFKKIFIYVWISKKDTPFNAKHSFFVVSTYTFFLSIYWLWSLLMIACGMLASLETLETRRQQGSVGSCWKYICTWDETDERWLQTKQKSLTETLSCMYTTLKCTLHYWMQTKQNVYE